MMEDHLEVHDRMDPSTVRIPLGMCTDDLFARYMFREYGVARQWSVASGCAIPFWEFEGTHMYGGKTHVLLDEPFFPAQHRDTLIRMILDDRLAAGSFATRETVSSKKFISTRNTYLLDLRPGLSAIRQGLAKKWRNQLKKAEQETTEFRPLTAADFDVWYALYVQRTRELHNVPRAPDRMRHFLEALGEKALWYGLWHDGRLVSCGLGYVHGAYATLWWQFSDRASWAWCSNNLFYWKLIGILCAQGVSWFDFGPTAARDPSGSHFKQGMGAISIPLWNRREPMFASFLSRVKGRIRLLLHV